MRAFVKRNWAWIPAVVVIFIAMVPVWWIVMSSITPNVELFRSPIRYVPEHPTLENYRSLFELVNVGKMIKDTFLVTAPSILLTGLISLLAAYGFLHSRLKISKVVFMVLMASSFLPYMSIIVPMFSFFSSLQMSDTFFVLILLYTSNMLPFSIMIFWTFMSQIPRSIEEATAIDGGGHLTILFRVLMPLMRSVVTTMAIINFITCVNEFTTPLIFTTNKITVLSVGLTMISRVRYQVPWDQISALVTIMLLPIVVFVAVFEKNILGGLIAGSIKS